MEQTSGQKLMVEVQVDQAPSRRVQIGDLAAQLVAEGNIPSAVVPAGAFLA